MEQEKEIHWGEIAESWWSRRKLVLIWALCGLTVGIAAAFLWPKAYTVAVKMVAESERSALSSELSGVETLLGVNLNPLQSNDDLSAGLYPDIVESTPFLSELCRQEIAGMDPRQADALLRRRRREIDVFTDNKSGLTTVSVTRCDPVAAAVMADSLVVRLERYLIDTRTRKARADLSFTAERYEEAKANYYTAQEAFARFVDANRHLSGESAAVERSRLDDERQLAYRLFSQLSGQLELTRIRVQEQTPVLTVIEPVTVPVRHSSPHRKLIVLAGLLLGAAAPMFVLGWKVYFTR